MFKSVDGGLFWSAMNTGLVVHTIYALAIDPATPTTVYAGTHAYAYGEVILGGVFKSTSGVATWSLIYAGLTSDFYALAVDPVRPAILYAGARNGSVLKSVDGGGTWGLIKDGPQINTLVIDPWAPANLYAGTEGGVFVSADGGGTWETLNTGLPILSIYALAIDPAAPANLYAGTKGAGVASARHLPVSLVINYSHGAPGSYFTVTGSNYPPDSTVSVTLNQRLLGTVSTDAAGQLVFRLETSPTNDLGLYRIVAAAGLSARTQFMLTAEGDLHASAGNGVVWRVPDGLVDYLVHLALIVK